MDVFVRGQFLGSEDDFRAIVAPLLAAAPPVTEDIRVEPFWEVAPRFTNPESENHSWGDISRFADAPLPESALERVVELIADAPSRSQETNVQFWDDRVGREAGLWNSRRPHGNRLRAPRHDRAAEADARVGEPHGPRDRRGSRVMDFGGDRRPRTAHAARAADDKFPNRAIVDWPEQYFAENPPSARSVKAKWEPRGRVHVSASVGGRALISRPRGTRASLPAQIARWSTNDMRGPRRGRPRTPAAPSRRTTR